MGTFDTHLRVDPELWQAFQVTCLPRGENPCRLLEAYMVALLLAWAPDAATLETDPAAQTPTPEGRE